jgi:hypothetical protein
LTSVKHFDILKSYERNKLKKEVIKMTIAKIKEILTAEFESAEDRKYWEQRLKEEERRERTGKENDRYFKVNAKYNR